MNGIDSVGWQEGSAPGADTELKVQALLRRIELLIGGFHQFTTLGVCGLTLKLRDVRTEVIREDDGSYAVACSALGVYSIGKTLKEAKRNFQNALDLHLSVLREKARRELATVVAR